MVLAFLYATAAGRASLIAQQIRGALDELAEPVPVLIVSADPAGGLAGAQSGASSRERR